MNKLKRSLHWKPAVTDWGLSIIIIHWLSALTIIGLFVLGLWMVELTYYSAWYQQAPHIHRSVGIILLIITMLRIAVRFSGPKPAPLIDQSKALEFTVSAAHLSLYILLLLLMFSGYLISTADGRAIKVFDWFELPALFPAFDKQEDIAGEVHYWLAMSLIALAILHTIAALKHHFINRDNTLRRMLKNL